MKISGGDSRGETPVPIPNTEVKLTTPKILGWRRPGTIGTARIKKLPSNRELFLCFFSNGIWLQYQSYVLLEVKQMFKSKIF